MINQSDQTLNGGLLQYNNGEQPQYNPYQPQNVAVNQPQPIFGQPVYAQQPTGFQQYPVQQTGGGFQQYPVQQPASGFQQYPIGTQPMMDQQGMMQPVMFQVSNNTENLPTYATGYSSTIFYCRTCNRKSNTIVNRQLATRGLVWMGVLFIIGCWPCCLIPLCSDDCKQNVHNCTGCGRIVSLNTQVIVV